MTQHRTPTLFPLTLYYDAGCRFCNAEMTNLMVRNTAGRLHFINAAVPGFADGPAPQSELMRAIHGVDAAGQLFIGVECLTRAYQGVGLGWVRELINLPGIRHAAHRLYPWLARNRYRLPQGPVAWVFEGAARRAAERTVRNSRRCANGECELPDTPPHADGRHR